MRLSARLGIVAGATSALVVVLGAAPEAEREDAVVPHREPALKDAPLNVVPELMCIDETRHQRLGKECYHPSPELTLTFDLGLPVGSGIAQIHQPKNLRASDDKGNDLSAVRHRNIPLERQWLFGFNSRADEAPTLTVGLVAPARGATTFSLSFDAELQVYRGIDVLDLPYSSDWTTLEHPTFKALGAEYRINEDRDLEIRPIEVRLLIQSALAVDKAGGDDGSRGLSCSYDARTLRYDLFPGAQAKGNVKERQIRVWAFANVSTVPVHVDIKDQKLP